MEKNISFDSVVLWTGFWTQQDQEDITRESVEESV
jgi:hypothetical protein